MDALNGSEVIAGEWVDKHIAFESIWIPAGFSRDKKLYYNSDGLILRATDLFCKFERFSEKKSVFLTLVGEKIFTQMIALFVINNTQRTLAKVAITAILFLFEVDDEKKKSI